MSKWLHTPTTRQAIAYAILSVTLGMMVGVIWPSLNDSGYLAGWDSAGHLLKAHYWAHNLLPGGHLTGWFPLWHGGFDIFQFYPPLLYYLLGPLTLLFPPELALRIFTAALWIGLVPATYYFLRSFKVDRLLAAIGASLLLILNASFGIGLGALYGVGLLPNGLGFILAIWVIGRLKRDLAEPERGPRQFVLTGVLFGLLILGHTFSAYWTACVSGILLAVEAFQRHDRWRWLLKRYALIIGIGLLISAFWWVPLVLNVGQMGQTGALQQSPRLEILKGLLLAEDSGGVAVTILAVAGFAWLALRKRWRDFAFLGSVLLFSLLLSLNTINHILPFSSVLASSQYIRFHAFFAWTMIVVAMLGLVAIWDIYRLARRGWLSYVLMGTTVGALFAAIIWPTLSYKSGFVRIISPEARQQTETIAGVLGARVKPGEFVLTEFNWEARFQFGTPHVANQRLPLNDNRIWDLDGNFPEGTAGAAQPVLTASSLEVVDYLEQQLPYLKNRGVRYIVTTQPVTAVRLESNPNFTKLVEAKAMAIFEINGFDTVFGLPSPVAAQLAKLDYDDPGRYSLTFRQPVSLPAGSSVALSYHPWLRVSADGRAVPAVADRNHQLSIGRDVTSVQNLEIEYRRPAALAIPATISAITGLVALAMILYPQLVTGLLGTVRRRRPRRRQPQ